jgi:hypothetical protein
VLTLPTGTTSSCFYRANSMTMEIATCCLVSVAVRSTLWTLRTRRAILRQCASSTDYADFYNHGRLPRERDKRWLMWIWKTRPDLGASKFSAKGLYRCRSLVRCCMLSK